MLMTQVERPVQACWRYLQLRVLGLVCHTFPLCPQMLAPGARRLGSVATQPPTICHFRNALGLWLWIPLAPRGYTDTTAVFTEGCEYVLGRTLGSFPPAVSHRLRF